MASRAKINTIRNQELSSLLPYMSLMIVSSVIVIVLFTYILEVLLLPRLWPTTWVNLKAFGNGRKRRSFTYHHVALVVMSCVLINALYPVAVFLCKPYANLSTPFAHGSTTIGDVLLVLNQLYAGYYLFEIAYRTSYMSPIGTAHHFGLLIISQTAVTLSFDLAKNKDATIEYYMAVVWATFDVIAEIPIHAGMIYWRLNREKSRQLMYMGYALYAWSACLATAETAVTIWLLHVSWSRWDVEWQISTPIIFSLWMSTQIYGSTMLFNMGNNERRKFLQASDIEIGSVISSNKSPAEWEIGRPAVESSDTFSSECQLGKEEQLVVSVSENSETASSERNVVKMVYSSS